MHRLAKEIRRTWINFKLIMQKVKVKARGSGIRVGTYLILVQGYQRQKCRIFESRDKEANAKYILPNPSLITEAAKTVDMICVSEGIYLGGRKLRSLVGSNQISSGYMNY